MYLPTPLFPVFIFQGWLSALHAKADYKHTRTPERVFLLRILSQIVTGALVVNEK